MPPIIPLRSVGDGLGSLYIDLQTGALHYLSQASPNVLSTITATGTVDNAAIADAIEDDPAAIRAAAGLSDGSVTEDAFLVGAADGSVTEASPTEAAALLRTEAVGMRTVTIPIFAAGTTVATGDAAGFGIFWRCPSIYNGWEIIDVSAAVHAAGTTGTTDFQLRRKRAGSDVDVCSTKPTIDSGETDTLSAATAAVIDASNDDLATGDRFYADVDAVASTPPTGACLSFTIRPPAA